MKACGSGSSELLRCDPFQFFDEIVGQAVAAGIGIEAQKTVAVKAIEPFSRCDPHIAGSVLYNTVDPVIRNAIFGCIDRKILFIKNLRLQTGSKQQQQKYGKLESQIDGKDLLKDNH